MPGLAPDEQAIAAPGGSDTAIIACGAIGGQSSSLVTTRIGAPAK